MSDSSPPQQLEALYDEHGYPFKLPKTLMSRITRHGTHFLPGVGHTPADIMFVQGYVFDEQAEDVIRGLYQTTKIEPKINKGGAFNTLRDMLGTLGLSLDHCYYTSFIKFKPPKGRHNKPPQHVVAAMSSIFDDEVERVKPKIIVVFGKLAFEQVTGMRMRFDHIRACWFPSVKHKCLIYVMPDALQPVLNPSLCEQMRIDLLDLMFVYESNKNAQVLDAWGVRNEDLFYSTITNSAELKAWVDQRLAENCNLLSVDCEFGGRTIVDCKLRSVQFCWKPAHAVYIRLMDDDARYVFDTSYEGVGAILAPLCDRPSLKYIGYSAAIDISRLAWFMKLKWYNKLAMDLQYGVQAYDESAEQGLERLAIQFTRMGRYDSDLMEWKSKNPDKVSEEHGYLYVPESILAPYACKDVDVPMRAYGRVCQSLIQDDTWEFYNNYANVLVGNLFITFMLTGLPVSYPKLDRLRELYEWGKTELEKEFIARYSQVVEDRLRDVMLEQGTDEVKSLGAFFTIVRAQDVSTYPLFNQVMGDKAGKYRVILDAYLDRANFKLRSSDDKCRWLFDVMGYMPVKSTANKGKGMYATPWERVLELPPEAQKLYSPAVDKQSLMIIAGDTGDQLVHFALQVIAVGSVRNGVLKPAELDDDGNLVKENGLHYWIASDGRIHCNFAATETWRPRAWKPNTLNWASYVHEGVAKAFKELLDKHTAAGTLPALFSGYADGSENIPSIRSVVDVRTLPPLPGSSGWIIVESDYDTAELVGQAYQSGDENFIRLVTEPDTQFGLIPGNDKARVRLQYANDSGIPDENRNSAFLMTWTEKGKLIASYDIADLARDPEGKLLHPRHDLHWGLVEYVLANPREIYTDKIQRVGVGKVGNFSCLSRTTKVLTNLGNIPILEIDETKHKLWDGVEWVTHEGLIEKPPQHTITYGGLTATVDHGVWTDDGREIFFGEAALQNLRLAETQNANGTARQIEFCDSSNRMGYSDAGRNAGLSEVQNVSRPENRVDAEHAKDHMPRMHVRPRGKESRLEISRNASAVRTGHACLLGQLQGTRHSVPVYLKGAIYSMGVINVSGGNVQWEGLRSDRQQRALLPGESSIGRQAHQSEEYTNQPELGNGARGGICLGQSKRSHSTKNHHKLVSRRKVGSGDFGTRQKRRRQSGDEAGFSEGKAGAQSACPIGAASGGYFNGGGYSSLISNRVYVARDFGELGTMETQLRDAKHPNANESVPSGEPDNRLLTQCAEQAVVSGSGDAGGNHEVGEQPGKSKRSKYVAASQGLQSEVSGMHDERIRDKEVLHARDDGRGSSSQELGVNGYRGRPKEVLLDMLQQAGFQFTIEPVYDLVNAGPRHRFTANGVLVSNTAYGASVTTLERKYKSDTGKEPEPGTGQRILDALTAQRPVAMQWLTDLEQCPINPGYVQTESGAKRHFKLHAPNLRGVSARTKKSVLVALAREARNFPLQNSVSVTAIRAAKLLMEHCECENIQHVYPMALLYDSIVTICPIEMRFVVMDLHERFMCTENQWHNHGRTWNYTATHEFNFAWSERPSKALQKQLSDRTYKTNSI
jgi:uracil-DNA glycosylase family 4